MVDSQLEAFYFETYLVFLNMQLLQKSHNRYQTVGYKLGWRSRYNRDNIYIEKYAWKIMSHN